MKIGRSNEETIERVWQLGIEAGFNREGYRRILEYLFNQSHSR
jgi:hypothetical protein